MLWKQFLAWHTNGGSSAPKAEFANKPIAQELKDASEYFGNDSDKRVHVDLEGEDERDIEMSIPRNNILLKNLPQPKLVKVPNGRAFYARYQRLGRHTLSPTKVRIKRTYVRKIGPGRKRARKRPAAQVGSGYVDANTIMNGKNLAKRGVNTDLGEMIIKDAVDFIPSAYNSLKIRILHRKKKSTSSTRSTPQYMAESGEFYN